MLLYPQIGGRNASSDGGEDGSGESVCGYSRNGRFDKTKTKLVDNTQLMSDADDRAWVAKELGSSSHRKPSVVRWDRTLPPG